MIKSKKSLEKRLVTLAIITIIALLFVGCTMAIGGNIKKLMKCLIMKLKT
ncbi:hypothetical protein AAAV47_05650 [Staphylococcus hominis]